jgi:hypothetical protein
MDKPLGRGLAYIKKAFDESRPADIDSTSLERALGWLYKNDGKEYGDLFELIQDIEDELDFRADGDPELDFRNLGLG